MTDKRMPIDSQDETKFRQVFYEEIKTPKKYTLCKMGEDDFMVTEVWKKIREQRLTIDGYRCSVCGTAKNLQVHHIHYPEVWGEEDVDNDLKTYCDSCHKILHANDMRKEKNETV